MTSERMLAGKCRCGAVQYEVADAFLYAANCHCSQCRAATGSAFKSFAGIEKEKLTITDGRGASQRHPLCGVRLVPRLGGAQRRVRARRDGVAGRRSYHPAGRAHLRRLQGAVVRDHRRSAAARGVRLALIRSGLKCRTLARSRCANRRYGIEASRIRAATDAARAVARDRGAAEGGVR